MNSVKETVLHEIDALRQMRDELRVQLHLASGEVKDGWDKLERKWLELEDKAKVLGGAAEHSAHNVADAAHLLLAEVRDGYQSLKRA
jgi:hypothetical protein